MERGYTDIGQRLLPDPLREVLPLSGENRTVQAKKIVNIGAVAAAVVGTLAIVGVFSQVRLANLPFSFLSR